MNERQMKGLKFQLQAQRFYHSIVNDLFRFGRHLKCAMNYRVFRGRTFSEWAHDSCIQNLPLSYTLDKLTVYLFRFRLQVVFFVKTI